MEATHLPRPDPGSESPHGATAYPGATAYEMQRRVELLVEALRQAAAEPGEHRLYQSGKLAGLFPRRPVVAREAARGALAEGLLEMVRTEPRSRQVVEWVRITPRGVEYLYEHESPRAVLLELKRHLGRAISGLPAWMEETRSAARRLASTAEVQAAAMLARLEELARRVEAALRRTDLRTERLPARVVDQWPWVEAALTYLDRRVSLGGACPLSELFAALRDSGQPALALRDFQEGLRRLQEWRAIQLLPAGPGQSTEPEFAFLQGNELVAYVDR